MDRLHIQSHKIGGKEMKIRKSIVGIMVMLVTVAMTACGNQGAEEVDIQSVMNQIEAEAQLPEDMTNLTSEALGTLYNMDSSMYVQFVGKFTEVGILGDEVVIIEAANKDAASKVLELLEARYEIKLSQMKDYLPDEYAKIEKGRVVQVGNYVAMLVGGDQEKLDEIFDLNSS